MLWSLSLLALANPGQLRHQELTAMAGAFSRFGAQSVQGSVEKAELPNFLRYVVSSSASPSVPQEQVMARSSELTKQLMQHLPAGKQKYSLDDILESTAKIIPEEQPPSAELAPEAESERGNLGSKQLRVLRKRLERNRLTMPLFDTRGWVRDFEKALKIQWEIYANGLSPMHVVVARSDWLYGTTPVV